MPVFRDENGNIIETPTEPVQRKNPTEHTRVANRELPPVKKPTSGSASSGRSADKTAKLSDTIPSPKSSDKEAPAKKADKSQTRLVRGSAGADSETENVDPVVGWIVITNGTGQGNSFQIGYGINTVGRGPNCRIDLANGDSSISRAGHFSVVYDPQGRNFYLQPGSGKNLTYMDGKPVLSPAELKNYSKITAGDTELAFMAFCNESFDWQDL